jgi:DNA replication licensing factor MCM4
MIPIVDQQLNDHFLAVLEARGQAPAPGEAPISRLRARVHHLVGQKRMRELDPTDIDTLVSVRGMVIRTSAIIPEMVRGHFRCGVCGSGAEVDVIRGRLDEPPACASCNTRGSLELLHNRCTFIDKQQIKLQETPESIPEGETPLTVML